MKITAPIKVSFKSDVNSKRKSKIKLAFEKAKKTGDDEKEESAPAVIYILILSCILSLMYRTQTRNASPFGLEKLEKILSLPK